MTDSQTELEQQSMDEQSSESDEPRSFLDFMKTVRQKFESQNTLDANVSEKNEKLLEDKEESSFFENPFKVTSDLTWVSDNCTNASSHALTQRSQTPPPLMPSNVHNSDYLFLPPMPQFGSNPTRIYLDYQEYQRLLNKYVPSTNAQQQDDSEQHVLQTNSLKDRVLKCKIMEDNWCKDFKTKWDYIHTTNKLMALELEKRIDNNTNTSEKYIRDIIASRDENSQQATLAAVVNDENENMLHLTEEQEILLENILSTSHSVVLVSKFNLNITRKDIETLNCGKWLNDSVINFYMDLLRERSEQRNDLPSVYAMNTFFATRLLSAGYTSIRRWTRKINIFEKDIIPVPIHNGHHWSMVMIHLKERYIRYYDSMGGSNPNLLNKMECYLQMESWDKRKKCFNTTDFIKESVTDSPLQNNGVDCGVFCCMTAEYITRNCPLTFTQADMTYFRKKMILEIVDGKLWH